MSGDNGALSLNKSSRPKSAGHNRPSSAGKIRPKKSLGGSPTGSERSNDDNRSFGTYSSAMLEIKNNRKRAEGDLQMLENRILLLKSEEQRALNKVKETRIRANDILQLKKRNEDSLNQKLQENLEKEMRVKAKRDQSNLERKRRNERMTKTKQSILSSRNDMYAETKGAGIKYENENNLMKQKIEEDNRKKAAAIKAKKEAALKKKREEQERKEAEIRRKYLEKQEEENRRTAAAERRIHELEKVEREMIERLKRTQMLQQKAYSELQESLEI